MNKNKYITTTLPYANSTPHIGHAFEFIIADALVRYFKQSGCDVFFNIGLDEHGLKIQQAAEKKGVTPKDYVNELAYEWSRFTEALDIVGWDNFYRTSHSDHYVNVQQFWIQAFNRGDIYRKEYSGTYCVGCESFKLDKDLVDGKCQDHPTTELQTIEEENYFFKLSKYKNKLNSWAYKATDFIEPKSKRADFLNIIDSIEDISVSRLKSSVSWGIPVPGDEDQIIYVWFDALLNYIFAAEYDSDFPAAFESLWNEREVIQICGPDNLKFQAVIFQGLLQSAGIKKTDKLLVHGTILDSEGHKMSKTLGNVVDPIDQLNKYGVDAVRYYALAGLRTYGNSSWDENQLIGLHNSHLADDFGNLVSRVGHLAGKILDEYSGEPNIRLDYSLVDSGWFCLSFNRHIASVIRPLWESYKISEALDEINKLVKSLNKKFGDEEPWRHGKDGWTTVLEVHYAISKISELYRPVIPGKIDEALSALRKCKKSNIFPKIEQKQIA